MDKAVFNHLALPQRLPGSDGDVDKIETNIVGRLIDACRLMFATTTTSFHTAAPGRILTFSTTWNTIERSIAASYRVNLDGQINKARLLSQLRSLAGAPTSRPEALVLHIRSQNAAILIHTAQVRSAEVVFEVFEASARNLDVLASEDALLRDFPGGAVAIPTDVFANTDFQESLADFLEQASIAPFKKFTAQTFKAGIHHHEDRDTPSPKMITSMLMALLEENGRRINTPLLRKRVRDDVCWNNAERPWRRLPYWLVLRVFVARYLALSLGPEQGRFEYKFALALVFAGLLDSSKRNLELANIHFLTAKLCRRLAKLDVDRGKLNDDTSTSLPRIDSLFRQLAPRLNATIELSASYVQSLWDNHKRELTRTIERLPKKANPRDMRLPLKVSGEKLVRMQRNWQKLAIAHQHGWSTPPNFDPSSATSEAFVKFANPLLEVTALEEIFRLQATPISPFELSYRIEIYLEAAIRLYRGDVTQMSLCILNIMEQWVHLDEKTCAQFPLLRDYHPVFTSELMDRLQLAHYHDMLRLDKIQGYLARRIQASGSPKRTIYENPSESCFARRFYDESPTAAVEMHPLQRLIEATAQRIKADKHTEWLEKSSEYDSLARQVNGTTCSYVVDGRPPYQREIHDEGQCSRCRATRRMSSMRIRIYEHPLPEDETLAKIVIFELACPEAFSEYRDRTWAILSQLADGFALMDQGSPPTCRLREYSQLGQYGNEDEPIVCLASTTKSFLKTHYATACLPVEWEGGRDALCKPNGLRLSYYDRNKGTWIGRRGLRPSFSHHLRLQVPKGSLLESSVAAAKTQTPHDQESEGISSYEIMASQPSCPAGINPHELMAFKTLLSGVARRWISILVELASSNLNWSGEATMCLVKHLALQCGPPCETKDSLRIVHSVFRDSTFVVKLLEQVESKLSDLDATGNYREGHLMAILIALAWRVVEFTSPAGIPTELCSKAISLLERSRGICIGWFRTLRDEIQRSSDLATIKQLQQRALAAAVLCRSTFVLYLGQSTPLDASQIETYIESTVAIQETLGHDIGALPRTVQQGLVSAIKLGHQLRGLVAESIHQHPSGFRAALERFWPGAKRVGWEHARLFQHQDDWISCDIPESDGEERQAMHFSITFGTLLVNGKPMGNLPQSCQNSVMMKDLFGNQQLRVFQSSLPGMTYTLAHRPNNFNIHVGYEGNVMVIIAKAEGQELRLLPEDTFHDGRTWDLPSPLVQDRFHWFNLATGNVHITNNKNNPWAINKNNWILNVQAGRCRRTRRDNHQEDVIDPNSSLFQAISKTLKGLAPPGKLLVTQPQRKGVEVRIPSLQLMFFVDFNQRLFSPQLRLEVDPNQDAGTWYGLESKLVCRARDDAHRRTILVPLGGLVSKRDADHVRVAVKRGKDTYGKFEINDTLGRIDCAAEPILVYTKAMLHAYTSFVLPDPLTGRTGAEEALLLLSSGISKPWAVLEKDHAEILSEIAKLTTHREYYPRDLRVMKRERWDSNLTSHLQHPLYHTLIAHIFDASTKKTVFHKAQSHVGDYQLPDLPSSGEETLQRRAQVRRQRHERQLPGGLCISDAQDIVYQPRDRSSYMDPCYVRVLQMTNLLREQPCTIETPNLGYIFSQVNSVGGYGAAYDTIAISERMKTDIVEHWGSLVEYCRSSVSNYGLMFLFATLAFRDHVDEGLLRTLIAFSFMQDLKELSLPPRWATYTNFRVNSTPGIDDMVRLMMPHRKLEPSQHESHELEEFLSGKERRNRKAILDAYDLRSEDDCRYLAKYLLQQWPCEGPSVVMLPRRDLLINMDSALEVIRPEWTRLYRNNELSMHLGQVQSVLDQHRPTGEQVWLPPTSTTSTEEITFLPCRARGGEVPQLPSDLMSKSFQPGHKLVQPLGGGITWLPLAKDPKVVPSRNFVPPRSAATNSKPQISQQEAVMHMQELHGIILEHSQTKSLVRRAYAEALLASLEALKNKRTPQQLGKTFYHMRDVTRSSGEVVRIFTDLRASMEAPSATLSSRRISWLRQGGLWPNITTVSLLEQLRSNASPCFGVGMRGALTAFGVALTKFQRDRRLNLAVMAGDTARFDNEEANIGHSNWNPEQHPDWLLLEIESNMLIRPNQVDVARATISPESGANSVLQMNMGQGKTSCIIPMVAASMADKKNLVRIIVPKALLLQTAQLLQSRLGGLLDRVVCHVPFSRRTPTTENSIRQYVTIHKQVLKKAGVMLCLPEHNLSFMLSGQQRLLDDQAQEARPMLRMHAWLKTVCRDVLDESDYTLAARTQLIYPSGSQVSVDGHPRRWLVIESILGLVDRHLYGLKNSFPCSIDVVRTNDGGFPIIYFLRHDAEDELLYRLASDITKGLGDVLPMRSLAAFERIAVKDFLTPGNRRLRDTTLQTIRALCPEKPHVRETVYLLRGLLVNRILLMSLKKRWNVQYGLHPTRDPIAVPFHAKGVPSEQSEWGHPDVSILFTCLAFYYEGLNESRLRQALTRVLKSDDPSTEYEKWIQSTDKFPESLRAWNSINVEDEMQMQEVWKAVRHQVVVIDYYLNNFVFPRHAKQFKVKLQSSGWDIPIYNTSADPVGGGNSGAKQLTTGFSGTNDNRTMLPLTIKQADLPTLSHTSAEVLTYLLHQRSRRCEIIRDVKGERATERDLLHMLKTRKIRILIDAGAYILEMDNKTLAETWLTIDNQVDAALYFDKDNKPWIISKKGRRTPLLASPYADDLSQCLVYLDEAHTRGTDLKLPLDARGALTVGQGQSKDHTVQAAMRLRQLGTTQSVTFFIPPEVHQEVVDLRGKLPSSMIDSHDVICWLLNNTCDSIEQLQPLYISQGNDFCRRTQSALDNPKFLTDNAQGERYKRSIKQNELQTLQEMYEPRAKGGKPATLKSSHPGIVGFISELNKRRKGFQDTGRAVHASALQEVEQEREVEFEVEAVRRVKKSVKYDAFTFPGLHRDLEMFARSGRLPADSHSMLHVFEVLSKSVVGRKHGVSKSGSNSKLFVSGEFLRTVKFCVDTVKDVFLRPVSWILWSEVRHEAVVVIPEEAECLMGLIRAKSTHPQVHLISYASPITKRMMVFNSLKFYSIPPLPDDWHPPMWLQVELGILAGRLYFDWDEYQALCDFLDIGAGSDAMKYDEEVVEDEGGAFLDGLSPIVADLLSAKGRIPATRSFSKRPLTFLQDWLQIRRHGQDFVHTPMGFLTQSKPLHEDHPFFSEATPDAHRPPVPLTARAPRGFSQFMVESDGEDHLDGVDDMGANVENDGEDDEGSGLEEMDGVFDPGSSSGDGESGSWSSEPGVEERHWFGSHDDSDSESY